MRMIEISVANDLLFFAVESADGDRFLGQLTGLAPVPDDLRLSAGMHMRHATDFLSSSFLFFGVAKNPRFVQIF